MATVVGKNNTSETLKGTATDDVLIGGDGENILYGLGGADVFSSSIRTTAALSATRDVIRDFEIGTDKIDLSAFGVSSWDQLTGLMTATSSAKTYVDFFYNSKKHVIELSNVNFSTLSASDFIFSTAAAKNETGTDLNDTLFGSTGADTLNGGAGADRLYGGDGDDVLDGGTSSDQLFGGNGNDTLYGSGDRLIGGDGDDILIGVSGGNRFIGGNGADLFKTGGTKSLNTVEYANLIDDFQVGIDKIDISASGISSWDQLKIVLTEKSGANAYFSAYSNGTDYSVFFSNVQKNKLIASDFVFSTAGSKKETGTDGGDRMFGSAFNDTLDGGRGYDLLLGGAGNDRLIGGYNSNELYGQAGADTFVMSVRLTDEESGVHGSSDSRDDIMDFQRGVDKIDVSAFGISSFEQLAKILKDTNQGAYFNAYYAGRSHEVYLAGVTVNKLTTADFIFDKTVSKNELGTEYDDRMFGSAKADVLGAGGGGNEIFAGAGNDTIIAGTSASVLHGEAGADTFRMVKRNENWSSNNVISDFEVAYDKIDVSAFSISSFEQLKFLLRMQNDTDAYFDAVYGYGTSHRVELLNVNINTLKASNFIFDKTQFKVENGTAGDDVLFGSATADKLNGAYGNDTLFGGAGDDVLTGGLGTNMLYGEAGADTFKLYQKPYQYEFSHDKIGDFQVGIDKIDLTGFDITSFAQLKLILEARDDGSTFFWFHRGDDLHRIELFNVDATKLTAADFKFGTQNLATMTGSRESDRLFGGKGANTLIGREGNDELFGGDGNDTLSGGEDANTLYGQGGADIFQISPQSGDVSEDRIGDFQVGVDKIDVSGLGITSFEQLKLIFETNGKDTFFDAYWGYEAHRVELTGVAPGKLSAGDFIFATQEARKLTGSWGDDRLFGGAAGDTLNGGDGNDDLFGGDGNDKLIGGWGNDRYFGGAGVDTAVFSGNKSQNYIVKNADGSVSVNGELLVGIEKIQFADRTISVPQNLAPTSPVLSKATVAENSAIGKTIGSFSSSDPEGGSLSYKLTDTAGGLFKLVGTSLQVAKTLDFEKLQKDKVTIEITDLAGKKVVKTFVISITDVTETVLGTSAAQTLKGGIGADKIIAGAGDDVLIGYDGNDLLFGDSGNDTLSGSDGADQLTGGNGKDVFLFKLLSDSTISSTGRDTILDFSVADSDRINVSGIDANTKLASDQAFSFLGTLAFSGKAGELRYEKKTSDTYIYGDVDGDKKTDFSIHLDDAVTLSKDYFVL